MGLFSFLTGSQKKTNLTPEKDYPSQEELFFTSPMAGKEGFSLKEVAKRRLQGQDLGFGEGFTDRMSSPGIAQIDKNFQNRTLPELSSQASKRGLARSSIIQDQIGQADLQRNRDIDSMVANFQYLNEQQKKRDTTEGINLASDLQTQQRGMLDSRAAASERQVGRNIEGDRYAQQYKDQAGKNIMGMVASAIGAGSGAMGMGGAPVGLGSQPGVGAISTYGANNVPQGFAGMSNPGGAGSPFFGGGMQNMIGSALGSQNATKTQLLGDDELDRLIAALSRGR